MGIYSWIDRTWLLPLAEQLVGRNIIGEYKKSLSIEWLSKEELYQLQCERLHALVTHCYKNVPYYTKLFDSLSISPDEIKCREDLSKIPLLTKELIRANYDDLISRDQWKRQYFQGSTGGSTGTPMKFLEDANTWNRLNAFKIRMWHNAGYEVGEKMFTLAGNSLVKKNQTVDESH